MRAQPLIAAVFRLKTSTFVQNQSRSSPDGPPSAWRNAEGNAIVSDNTPFIQHALGRNWASAAEKALTAFELKGEVHELMARLESRGAYIHIPRRDREYAVEVGVRTLLLRHIVIERDGQYRANPAEMGLLAYYANSIAHLDRADTPTAVPVPA
jgi:hypothetical protein